VPIYGDLKFLMIFLTTYFNDLLTTFPCILVNKISRIILSIYYFFCQLADSSS